VGGRRSVAASVGLPRRPPVFIPRRRRPPPAGCNAIRLSPGFVSSFTCHLPAFSRLTCARPRAGVPCATNPDSSASAGAGDLARKLVTVDEVNGGGVYVLAPVNCWISLVLPIGAHGSDAQDTHANNLMYLDPV
jgi:hypothetical protein